MTPHCRVAGNAAPTLVFTHGLASTGHTWSAQVDGLSARFRCVTWDLRGHGASPSPDQPCSMAALASDLLAVLDAAEVDRAVVIGHSAGGVIAMRFALDHPGRTAGLVLVGTASECNDRAAQFYEELARIALERGMDPVRRRLGLGNQPPSPVDPAAFAAIARCMAGLRADPLTPEVEKIRCPTLIVVGEKDFLGAGGSVILSRRIAGSVLKIVPERGHGIFLEDPAGFNALLAEFAGAIS